MAEALKDSFGPDIPDLVVDLLGGLVAEEDRAGFVAACLDGYEALELTPRGKRISDCLADVLPADRGLALRGITAAIRALPEEELHGMEAFRYMPLTQFVADHGLEHFEESMAAQHALTQRFSAEFSIRAFLEHHEAATLDRLREWTSDPSEHVRRLVSEGTRPRLPWAGRLRRFMADPSPVLSLLEALKDDPSDYVRRSVANNLNDIAKDHPGVVLDVARRWWADGDANRRALVRHGLRTLIKRGDPDALAVMGFSADSTARTTSISVVPDTVAIGDKVRVEALLDNPGDTEAGALADLVVSFVKADGSTSDKVFKGVETWLAPGGTAVVRKTISLRQHTTRTHYPGTHRVTVQLNGRAGPSATFELLP